MPQSNNVLRGMSSAPIATGIESPPAYGFEGVPGLGAGGNPLAMMAMMFAAPQMQRMMAARGVVPMGIGHDQNTLDYIRRQQFAEMQSQAITKAAEMDRDSMMRTMRGMSALAGIGFGAEQRRGADAVLDIMTMGAPVLTKMAPDVLDALGGSRGSAAVMARRMTEAGRYRMDPVTGRMGLSAATSAQLSQQLFHEMYVGGDPRDMMGVTAGQAGALFGELTNRGMVPGSPGGAAIREQTRSIMENLRSNRPAEFRGVMSRQGIGGTDVNKLTAEDLDKITLDDTVATKLRAFDAEKIKRSVKTYAGAVSAMRDIFGDMGHPNAPMQELFGGLEAMTMGAMSQMDPGRVGMMVRQTYNLAKQSGVTLDHAMILQQHAGARAQALGLEPIFGALATQGALAFGGAYRSQGFGGHPAWGLPSADAMVQLDSQMRLQAAGSPMANQLAVALRLNQGAVGGFQKGSEAESVVQAALSGADTYVDAQGKAQPLNMSQGQMVKILSQAKNAAGQAVGAGEADILNMFGQTFTNRGIIQEAGLMDTVRRAQSGDIRTMVGMRLEETLGSKMRALNMTPDAINQAGDALRSTGAAGKIMALDPATFAKDTDRDVAIARIMRESLAGTAAGAQFVGPEGEQALRLMAGQFRGNTDRFIQSRPDWRYQQNLIAMQRLNHPDVMAATARDRMRARHDSEMQEAMSPLNRGGMVSRLVDAIQRAEPGDEGLKTVLARTFGVEAVDLNKAMLGPMRAIADRRRALEEVSGKILKTTDPVEKAKLEAQRADWIKELKAQSAGVVDLLGRYGVAGPSGVTPSDTNSAIKATDAALVWMRRGQGTSGTTTAAEHAAFFASPEGERMAEEVDNQRQKMENIASKLLHDPAAVTKFGMQALDMHKELRLIAQNKRMIEATVYGGSAVRAAADYPVDTSTPEKLAAWHSGRRRMLGMMEREGVIAKALGGTHGNLGGQYQLPSDVEALILDARLKDPGLSDIYGPISAAAGGDQVKIAQAVGDPAFRHKLTPDQQDRLLRTRESIGNIREALGALGLRPKPGQTPEELYNSLDEDKKREVREMADNVAAGRRLDQKDERAVLAFGEAYNRIGAASAARGISVTDILTGKRPLDANAVSALSEDVHTFAAGMGGMMKIVKEKGLPGWQAAGGIVKYREAVLNQQKGMAEKDSMRMIDVISEFREEFGHGKIGPMEAKDFASLAAGGSSDRQVIQDRTWAHQTLRGHADASIGVLERKLKAQTAAGDAVGAAETKKQLDTMRGAGGRSAKTAGVDAMVAEYRTMLGAKDRPAARSAFMQKHEMTEGGMKAFDASYDLLNQGTNRLLDFGADRLYGGGTSEEIGKAIKGMGSSKTGLRGGGEGKQVFPDRMTLSGTLTLNREGTQAKLTDVTGGLLPATTP